MSVNYYAVLEGVNVEGRTFLTSPQAFISEEERDAWIAEAPTATGEGVEWRRVPVSERVAEDVIFLHGCTRHGGAEYTDAMYDFDEHERMWLEDELDGEDW